MTSVSSNLSGCFAADLDDDADDDDDAENEDEEEVEEDADEKGEDVCEGEGFRAKRDGIRPSFSKAEKEGRSSAEIGDCGKVGEECNGDGVWKR